MAKTKKDMDINEIKRRVIKEVGKKVDVVEYCAIRKQLRERILNEEIPIGL